MRRMAMLGCVGLVLGGGCVRDTQQVPRNAITPGTASVVLPVAGSPLAPSTVIPADFTGSPAVEVFGNFHTAGIIVSLSNGPPALQVGQMRAYINDGGAWSRVQDPVQVGAFPWFASSLFWLQPDSRYQVKVEVLDRAGATNATWYGEGATRAEPAIRESQTVYYVATNGNDSAAGTREAPWATFAKALATVRPGETVLVRGGTYYEGDLEIAANGRAGAPIVIRAFPGESPVLTAADPAAIDPAAWRDEGDGLLSFPSDATYANVCLEDLDSGRIVRVFAVPALTDLRARKVPDAEEVPSKPFAETGVAAGSCFDGTRVHIAPPAGFRNYRIHLARRAFGIVLHQREHVQIEGLEFRYFSRETPGTALMVQDASDVLVQNCRFMYDDCQIYLKGNSDRLTVQGCTFVDGILDWPFGYMKMSGAAGPYEGGCVNVDSRYSGRGLVFRRNHIDGVFDGMHLTPWMVDTARTQETDFYENTVWNCIDDFLEVDGYARNVRIFDNVMNASLSGISLAQALDGPTYIVYNVIAGCGMVPAAWREENYGYPFKTNGGPEADVGTGAVFFYHNTAYTEDPESRAILVKFAKWRKLTFRNNIWCGQRVGAEFWRKEISPMDFDYDNLYVADTNAPTVLVEYHQRVDGLEAVRRRFGWLPHGISADPRLRDPAAIDFRLSTDSPCIDAGTPVPGINAARTRGKAPDMGAYEAR